MSVLYLLLLVIFLPYNSAYGCKSEFSDSVTSETHSSFKGDISLSERQAPQGSFPVKIIVSGFYYKQEEDFYHL